VIAQEFLRHPYILIRKTLRISGLDFLVLMRLAEIDAIERAIDRDFALCAATDGADVPADARAETPRAANMANRARHFSSIEEGDE